MGLLEKIETAINFLLVKLGELALKLLARMVPAKVKVIWPKVVLFLASVKANFKQLPKIILNWLIAKLKVWKQELFTYDYKGKFQASYVQAMARYKRESPEKMGKIKTIFLTPFLIIAEWLSGLSATQALVLLTFTGASFLSGIGMIFSGKRIVDQEMMKYREPASFESDVSYDRPGYYKKQTRHLDITSLRLPVYVANVNELRTIDIDISATLSNRFGRMALEKYEFQLRDYLILHVEPSVASFPLEEEGKIIIKEKIWKEIEAFMKEREIEGQVVELKMTYILAN